MKTAAAIAFAFLAGAAQSAIAADQPANALFKVEDVNRDTVPAGTPAAFWAAFGESPKNEAERTVDDVKFTYVPLTLIPLPDGKTALISTGASECTGTACSGKNSVHYLQGDKASYKVTGEWLDVGSAGVAGNPALRWGWTDAIESSPMLYTEGGGTWQGYSCSYASLTRLGATAPEDVAQFPVYYSDGGANENNPVEYTGEITSTEKGRSFTVTYTGSKTFSERYVLGSDGKYTLASGESRVPTC